jgi:hypothetical protein
VFEGISQPCSDEVRVRRKIHVNPDAVNQVRAAFTKLPVAGRVSTATADRKLMGAHPVIPDGEGTRRSWTDGCD